MGHEHNHEHHGRPHPHGDKHKKIVCHTETCEKITIAVPAEVSAHADIKAISLECEDKRVIKERKRNSMKFEIVQEIFAKIPIDFVAEVEVKNETVDFDTHECNP
ncbi:MAG: hypothetical protein FWB96_11780 [Defluviitaleaceae bacterium]|nr:hypothetical protein [Defluviitaleaceae bacterium]MCL2263752.1 hypothetical protein [Defluviitaleaceae bacterium]